MGELKLRDDRKAKLIRAPLSPRLRFKVLQRDGFTCQYCGRTGQERELEIDHIVPVSKGGTNDIGNLQTACKECNRGKLTDEIISQYTEVKVVEKVVYNKPNNDKGVVGLPSDVILEPIEDKAKRIARQNFGDLNNIKNIMSELLYPEHQDSMKNPPTKKYIEFCKERMRMQGEEIVTWSNDKSFPFLVLVCNDIIECSKLSIDA